MIDMLKRHEIQVLRDAGHPQREVATRAGVSVASVRRVERETEVHHLDLAREWGRVLTLDGPSPRTKHLGLDDAMALEASDQAARISGIYLPESPEPTRVRAKRAVACR